MSRVLRLSLAAMALLLVSCGTGGAAGLSVITHGEHRLTGDHPSALLIMGGSVIIETGATIRNSAWLMDGELEISGTVEQDLSILGGGARFAPGARVGGDLNLAGGSSEGLDELAVDGQVTDRTGLELPLTPGWQRDQPLLTQLAVALGQTLIVAGSAFLIALVFPRPLRRVEEAVVRQPLVSVALGLLGSLVILPLIVFMAFTVVLIPVALAGLVLLGLALVYGWTAIGTAAARRPLARGRSLALIAAVGAGALSLAAQLATLVPFVGSIVVGLAIVAGFGAVMYTRFGTRTVEAGGP